MMDKSKKRFQQIQMFSRNPKNFAEIVEKTFFLGNPKKSLTNSKNLRAHIRCGLNGVKNDGQGNSRIRTKYKKFNLTTAGASVKQTALHNVTSTSSSRLTPTATTATKHLLPLPPLGQHQLVQNLFSLTKRQIHSKYSPPNQSLHKTLRRLEIKGNTWVLSRAPRLEFSLFSNHAFTFVVIFGISS